MSVFQRKNTLLYVKHLKRYLNKHLTTTVKETRRVNIEIVPKKIDEYLFGKYSENSEDNLVSDDDIFTKIKLPSINSPDLLTHLEKQAQEQIHPYAEYLDMAMKIQNPPKMPKNWPFQKGWSVYNPFSERFTRISYPDENILFFDIEVCPTEGQFPVLAIAMSSTKWYIWCSESLIDKESPKPDPRNYKTGDLISLFDKCSAMSPKILIGHHIGYDRSRVSEEYSLKKSSVKYWCTMAMHIAIRGATSQYESSFASVKDIEFEEQDEKLLGIKEMSYFEKHEIAEKIIRARTCKNSLSEIYRFLFEKELKKEERALFVKGILEDVRQNFQDAANYCARDVFATFEVFRKIYPEFKERFPNPITYAGMLEMSKVFLPVNKNWYHFADHCDRLCNELKNKSSHFLIQSARSLAKDLDADEMGKKKYEFDPWMFVCDWTVKNRRSFTNKSPQWLSALFYTSVNSTLPLEEITPDHVVLSSRVIPRIFGLCFGPYPMFHHPLYGWCFLVPSKSDSSIQPVEFREIELPRTTSYLSAIDNSILKLIEENKEKSFPDVLYQRWKSVTTLGIFDLYRLPHPNGAGKNVGNPFSKDFQKYFDQKTFHATRFSDKLDSYLEAEIKTRYWDSYRDRYLEEIVVWQNDHFGAIAPSVVSAGTITRRSVHKLWMTSANKQDDLIGSDMKMMVQSPDGYKIVGADVDSQEQWIAAIFGDSACDELSAGSTPFSEMLLAGDKAKQTDLHSVVAKTVGIGRSDAKLLNYARLYGSGQNHARDYMKRQGIVAFDASERANKLFATTKGISGIYNELSQKYEPLFLQFLQSKYCPPNYKNLCLRISGRYFLPVKKDGVNKITAGFEGTHEFIHCLMNSERIQNCSFQLQSADDVFREPPYRQIQLFLGGYESYTFNFLQLMAISPKPKTPVLSCRLTAALEPLNPNDFRYKIFADTFRRTITNWFVQSSAVDFLHMMLVTMRWLCDSYDIDAKFMISIHDEVRYLVKEEDKYRCALALMLSNMYTRAAFSAKLGIRELPRSVAFFSQVDIDTILRKEPNNTCKLPNGESVPFGEALTIEQIIAKTSGSLEKQLT